MDMYEEIDFPLPLAEIESQLIDIKPRLVIFDLDGTLANIEHRIHLIRDKPKDWGRFYRDAVKDTPYPDIAQLFHMFFREPVTVMVVTGREGTPDNVSIARNWLSMHYLSPDRLIMRDIGDHRPDYVVKEEILKELQKTYDVFMVFEDRKQVVDMYRRNGVRCLQVKEGDY